MNLKFLPQARSEFVNAVRYYNSERPGLGFEFSNEVRNALTRIKKYPEAWPLISVNIRKCIVNRFPFSVLYFTEELNILIIAVMHHKRKPGYWQSRTSNLINDD